MQGVELRGVRQGFFKSLSEDGVRGFHMNDAPPYGELCSTDTALLFLNCSC